MSPYKDARAAQIFTLAHELAHLWLGESGISDPFAIASEVQQADSTEAFCNAVAAEFLVPEARFRESWRHDEGCTENVNRLVGQFKVSRIVVALRAKELGFMDPDKFWKILDEERCHWRRQREESSGGGDYYRSSKTRNGPSFFIDVISAAQSGDVLLRDAVRLLDMKPSAVDVAFKKRREGRL